MNISNLDYFPLIVSFGDRDALATLFTCWQIPWSNNLNNPEQKQLDIFFAVSQARYQCGADAIAGIHLDYYPPSFS